MRENVLYILAILTAIGAFDELSEFLVKTNYDVHELPKRPVNVSILVGLLSLREVDKKSYTFKLRVNNLMAWYDNRLSGVNFSLAVGELPRDIWVPDIAVQVSSTLFNILNSNRFI